MTCYHCTEPLPQACPWHVIFDGESRDVCCAGCQAIMQAIIDAELGDYYRFRTEPAAFGLIPENIAAYLDELSVFDEPEISERYLHPATASAADSKNIVDLNLAVEGLRCGACVWVMERSLRALPGVLSANVNFSTARATVRFDTVHLTLSDILRRVTKMGYQSTPFDAREREQALKRESRVYLQRLFLAAIATMQVMMYALPAYLSDSGDIDPRYEQLLRWASLVLTTPVLVYSAWPFLRGAWFDIKRRQPGMDVPVSIGILAAYFASVWATVTGRGEIYFDSVAMFVFLLLGARYLEWSVRRRAMRAVDDISSAAPETAQRLTAEGVDIVPAVRLREGDLIAIDEGARIPVDGTVKRGNSTLNNSLITGESIPVAVKVGDTVPGGALLTGSPIQLRVLRAQSASTLSIIDRLIDRGATEKPIGVQTADRLATGFVSALLIFATLVWLVWMQWDPDRAAVTAIAVLVVSCPCALSLATPAALAAATGSLLKQKVLITRGHALETLASVTDVVFDKTGTLTSGQPVVCQVQPGTSETSKNTLAVAALLETGSTHPYAHALKKAAAEALNPTDVPEALHALQTSDALRSLEKAGYPAQAIEHCSGHGVSALWQNEHGQSCGLFLGTAEWCGISDAAQAQLDGQQQHKPRERAASEVYLTQRTGLTANDELIDAQHLADSDAAEAAGFRSVSTDILARFLISDTLRSEASVLIDALRLRGLTIHLLSGDHLIPVRDVADTLNINHYHASATPAQKQAYVADLQHSGAIVMMIGDGINDAPVLASANVSVAAGDATSLARTAADIISLRPGLEGLEHMLGKSLQTRRIVRQNLLWALVYNATAIPLAAFGLVPPWAAAIGMAISSLLVAANAQRLWTHSPRTPESSHSPVRHLWNHSSS